MKRSSRVVVMHADYLHLEDSCSHQVRPVALDISIRVVVGGVLLLSATLRILTLIYPERFVHASFGGWFTASVELVLGLLILRYRLIGKLLIATLCCFVVLLLF